MVDPLVGIIANPSSGKDIRRLVAQGSVFDNNEKASIVRRVLAGLYSRGVRRVAYMPDFFGIVPRALDTLKLPIEATRLDFEPDDSTRDSTRAAAMLSDIGASVIVSLGGDGTNRAIALARPNAPLVAISTGTNNVFPSIVEGTLAGIAAGLIARGDITAEEGGNRAKRLVVLVEDRPPDLALVDVARVSERYVGARAVWSTAALRELVLAIAEPGSIGLSAIGANISPIDRAEKAGLHLHLGDRVTGLQDHGGTLVMAPIAPGLVVETLVQSVRRIGIGESVELCRDGGALALDGEREIVLRPGQPALVRLEDGGPLVIDVRRVLELAAKRGLFSGQAPKRTPD